VKRSQRKGADGEREVARELRAIVGDDVDRTGFQQAYRGGFDLMLPHCAVEVKRYAQVTEGALKLWWEETEEQSREFSLIGVLAYRGDRQKWSYMVPHVIVRGSVATINYSITHSMRLFAEGFLWWYETVLSGHPHPIRISTHADAGRTDEDQRIPATLREGDRPGELDQGNRELPR
jgi:hypothetical protein